MDVTLDAIRDVRVMFVYLQSKYGEDAVYGAYVAWIPSYLWTYQYLIKFRMGENCSIDDINTIGDIVDKNDDVSIVCVGYQLRLLPMWKGSCHISILGQYVCYRHIDFSPHQMDIPVDVIPLIQSFATTNLRPVVRSWRDVIDQEAMTMVERMREKYPGLRRTYQGSYPEYSTIFTSLQDAIIARDVNIVEPILRYSGYIPINWDLLLFSCIDKNSTAYAPTPKDTNDNTLARMRIMQALCPHLSSIPRKVCDYLISDAQRVLRGDDIVKRPREYLQEPYEYLMPTYEDSAYIDHEIGTIFDIIKLIGLKIDGPTYTHGVSRIPNLPIIALRYPMGLEQRNVHLNIDSYMKIIQPMDRNLNMQQVPLPPVDIDVSNIMMFDRPDLFEYVPLTEENSIKILQSFGSTPNAPSVLEYLQHQSFNWDKAIIAAKRANLGVPILDLPLSWRKQAAYAVILNHIATLERILQQHKDEVDQQTWDNIRRLAQRFNSIAVLQYLSSRR